MKKIIILLLIVNSFFAGMNAQIAFYDAQILKNTLITDGNKWADAESKKIFIYYMGEVPEGENPDLYYRDHIKLNPFLKNYNLDFGEVQS